MKYSRNQVIVLTVLSVVAVASIVVRSLVNPVRGSELVSTRSVVIDTIFEPVGNDSVADTIHVWPKKECFSFELNGVTKAELMTFPGIANGRASAIVGYRERLGGYYSIDQLREINCMPDSLVDRISKWAWVAEDSIRKMDVCSMKVSQMKYHPYIREEQAQKIDSARWVKRKKRENFSVDSCKFAFSEEQWEKVKHYIR